MNNNYNESFELTKIAGNLAAETLDEITSYVEPGISTNKLDKICYEFIRDNGGHSAPLFYKGFPKSCCTSTNHVVCHGIPTNKYLREGDIINIDVTAIINGWHGDTSRMFHVGEVSTKSKNLVSTTYESQALAEKKGYSVVRDFCGHGIGRKFHEPPNILHYGKKGDGIELVTGMIFTVEPMINEGLYDTKILKDGWTAVTKDKTLSAQFEHTVGVTNEGFEIFTKSKKITINHHTIYDS